MQRQQLKPGQQQHQMSAQQLQLTQQQQLQKQLQQQRARVSPGMSVSPALTAASSSIMQYAQQKPLQQHQRTRSEPGPLGLSLSCFSF
jgi:hypothetical protein